jgi:hypothetical protein
MYNTNEASSYKKCFVLNADTETVMECQTLGAWCFKVPSDGEDEMERAALCIRKGEIVVR